MTRRRRGRPRLPGARGKSGRLIAARDEDKGTDQIQAQRAWLAQYIDEETGAVMSGDPVKTSYPLGVLLGNGTLDQQQHDAGVRYARLYCQVAGRATPPAIILDDDRAGRAPEDDEQREKRRVADEQTLKDAAAALHEVSSKAKSIVDNVSVYSRFPRWMFPVRPRVSDVREADALIAGLEALARAFGYRRDRRAA